MRGRHSPRTHGRPGFRGSARNARYRSIRATSSHLSGRATGIRSCAPRHDRRRHPPAAAFPGALAIAASAQAPQQKPADERVQDRCQRGVLGRARMQRIGRIDRLFSCLGHRMTPFPAAPFEQQLSFPRRHCVRVVNLRCIGPHSEGWAERRQALGLVVAPAGATRPITRDARLSALHRGGFGLRFRASGCGISSAVSCSDAPRGTGRIARRAVSVPPGTAVTSRSRGTPHLAPPSGSSLEDAPR